MKRIRSKLNNSQGVSIIIALVFMLICLFVGGTVLTAATVNAGRMKAKDNSKNFLDYRSAAILLADALKTDNNQLLRLDIIQDTVKTEDITLSTTGKVIKVNNSSAPATTIRFVCYQDITDYTLQRMVVETAVRLYQANSGGNVQIRYTKADGTEAILTEDQFRIPKLDPKQKVTATLNVELDENGTNAFVEHCQVTCETVDLTTDDIKNGIKIKYDYIIKLRNEEYRIAIDVRMDASTSTKQLPTITEIISNGNYVGGKCTGKRYTKDQDITSIIWHGPVIAKPPADVPEVETTKGGA